LVPLLNVPARLLVKLSKKGFHGRRAPAAARRGLYAQEFYGVTQNDAPLGALGYPRNAKGPPSCNVAVEENGVNGIAVDTAGDLIVPDAFDGIYVFAGPGLCGSELADIPGITDLQATDAAANNAATGTIVVGYAEGVVSTCTVTSNACTELATPNSYIGAFMQVAMDGAGNCYADGLNDSRSSYSLWYYAGCSATGVQTTGFSEPEDGGIDVDNKGNVVVLAQGDPSTLTVYSGCSTGACSVLTGPTSLDGAGDNDCVYGHLDRENQRYACGDYSLGQVDVYTYLPTRAPTYLYSFNSQLEQADEVEAAAYAPHSSK
jgi:hypothetical protein